MFLGIILDVGFWGFVALFCVFSWFGDLGGKVSGFVQSRNIGKPDTATYTSWGYVRMTNDPAMLAQIDTMHEREMALKTLKEDHRHEEVKTKLTNALEVSKLKYALEQAEIKRRYYTSIVRASSICLMFFGAIWRVPNYLDRKHSRTTEADVYLEELRIVEAAKRAV